MIRLKLNAVVLRNVDNIHLAVYKAHTKREQSRFLNKETKVETDYGWRINDRSRIFYANVDGEM